MSLEGDTNIPIIQSVQEGHVVLDFRRAVRYLALTPDQALNMAQGLVEDAKTAAAGIQIVPDGGIILNPDRHR